MSDKPRENFNFVVALDIAKRRYKSSRHWKVLEGTPWENDAPVFAADLMHETYRFYSHTLAEECWTIAHCALRDIISELGRDPTTDLPNWQKCVDRIHDRARLALEKIRQLEEAHADAFFSGRDSGDRRTGKREMTNIQRFTVYRRDISQRTTHTELHRNPDDAPQCQGVIWTDGTVTLRWLTACRSTSVWASIEDCLNIHGHPEYGTVIEWHDGPPPEAWLRQVATHRAALEAKP